jgi:choline dehydrogenase-like flavoprotein
MPGAYDVIILGTGAGGGTLARHLAPSGKRILLLERGDWLPRELENCDAEAVFLKGRYVSSDTWYDRSGKSFQPQIHYFVGGATKLYGAALYRQRREDFAELRHEDGVSPAWPISYDEMEPYYTRASASPRLFCLGRTLPCWLARMALSPGERGNSPPILSESLSRC